MITYPSGACIIQDVSELPQVRCDDLFLDTETSTGDRKKKSLNPWKCQPCGIAFTWDNHKQCYYIPTAHYDVDGLVDANLPWGAVCDWLKDTLDHSTRWINHNVKYDAIVLANTMLESNRLHPQMVDTIPCAKILDSDRGYGRGTYELSSLVLDYLGVDMTSFEKVLKAYLDRNNQDYGFIPYDIVGEYGAMDVKYNRLLWMVLNQLRPDQCTRVWNTEIAVTETLYYMEQRGCRIKLPDLETKHVEIEDRVLELSEQCSQEVGYAFEAHKNADCFDVLVTTYGLPILGWTDTGNASFDKDTLRKYLQHPDAPRSVVEKMLEIRTLKTLDSLFIKNWMDKHIDQVLHPSFNQCIRTARMSCKDPNAQQFNAEAKKHIFPHEGYIFFEFDYSQIEFRLICHIIKDRKAIKAYSDDPDTDFHAWVAEMCEIPRKPAKNVNFCMGYGGGKKKLLAMLAASPELMELVREEYGDDVSTGQFNHLCKERAQQVYMRYHDTLPSLKLTSRRAAAALKSKGHVFNLAGRRRHMPPRFAHKAFNSLCQSGAADIVKDRLVALDEYIRPYDLRDDAYLWCTVHDSVVGMARPHILPEIYGPMREILETDTFGLSVPMRVDFGYSALNWFDCEYCAHGLEWKECAPCSLTKEGLWEKLSKFSE